MPIPLRARKDRIGARPGRAQFLWGWPPGWRIAHSPISPAFGRRRELRSTMTPCRC